MIIWRINVVLYVFFFFTKVMDLNIILKTIEESSLQKHMHMLGVAFLLNIYSHRFCFLWQWFDHQILNSWLSMIKNIEHNNIVKHFWSSPGGKSSWLPSRWRLRPPWTCTRCPGSCGRPGTRSGSCRCKICKYAICKICNMKNM